MILSLMATFFLAIADSSAAPNAGLQLTTDQPDSSPSIKISEKKDSLKVYQMKELVVTASRTPMSIRTVPASVSLLEYDSLTPGIAAAIQLSQFPGASLGATGGLGSVANLSLRGSAANSTLYLLDGLPLNSAQNGQFDLNKLFDIQRIEMVRGPSSTLYGPNAAAGVINIITGSQPREKPYSKVNFEKGSHNLQVWEASVSLPLAQWAWSDFGMSWKKTDGYRTNSDYDGTNYFLNLGARLAGDIEAKIYYKEYKSECGVPGSLDYPSSTNRQSDYEKNFNLRLSYRGQSYLAISRNSIDNIFNSGITFKNYTLQTNLDAQYTIAWMPGITTITGASYQLVESQITNVGQPEIRRKGGFLIQQLELLKALLLVAGARYDKDFAYPYQISPSLSVSYAVTKNYIIYSNWGKGFRPPTLNELYYRDEAWLYYGNPELKPEVSQQFEAGVKANWGLLEAQVASFKNKTKDLVIWQFTPSDWSTRAVNLGNSLSQGVELEVSLLVLKRATLSANYTYCHAYQDTTNNPQLPYKPQHTANASLSVNDLPIVSDLKLGWKFWVQYTDIQKSGVYDPVDHLPAYIVSNQALSLKIADARVYYRVENLFNANYQTRYGYPMPRRTHSLGVIFEMWD